MKQLIICLLLVISTGLLAQSEKPIEKGQLMLGGGQVLDTMVIYQIVKQHLED